jgi:hypothetical protein
MSSAPLRRSTALRMSSTKTSRAKSSGSTSMLSDSLNEFSERGVSSERAVSSERGVPLGDGPGTTRGVPRSKRATRGVNSFWNIAREAVTGLPVTAMCAVCALLVAVGAHEKQPVAVQVLHSISMFPVGRRVLWKSASLLFFPFIHDDVGFSSVCEAHAPSSNCKQGSCSAQCCASSCCDFARLKLAVRSNSLD